MISRTASGGTFCHETQAQKTGKVELDKLRNIAIFEAMRKGKDAED
jgi:hypothetical protein